MTKATPIDWLRLFRARNYPNYIFVVIAAVAVSGGHPPIRELIIQFLLFGICLYSGIYIVNEVVEAELDRQHPVKCHRPVPSGRIPAWQALMLAAVLWAIAFGAAAPVYRWHYLGFIGINLIYSFFLKRHRFRNLVAITSALRVSLGFVIAGKGPFEEPAPMLLCTLFMAAVQQVKFAVEGTIGGQRAGVKLLGIAAAMMPVAYWCWPTHPIVVLWTHFAMGVWVLIPWRFPPAARWLIGADVPSRDKAAPPRTDMVVFDIDGTLCDSMQAILAAVNEMGPPLGFAAIAEPQYRQLRDLTVRQIQKSLGLSAWKLGRLGRHVRSALRGRAADLQAIPGIVEEVRSLQRAGYRLAIVSSNQRANVELFLRAHDLDGFEEIITHQGWGLGLGRKRRQLAELMARHRHDVRRIVYVGDELRDVEAGRAAGVPVVAVTWGANSAEVLAAAGPAALIHTPAELHDAVRQALSGEPAAAPLVASVASAGA